MLKQEGYDLMGAAFEVYNELGYGMAEDVFQRVGNLINFGKKGELEWKRFLIDDLHVPKNR
ncbi:GxxExxY protein [Novipirellula artificiosorum]|uniref:Uncharacterized protein n=1 Tax=Novipirellula artificiosorum TaxID=2528016 RepID=A0A5C6E6H6_9BACT|nr:GxxExxY protein [Novipirellula artificiosorum]TWU42779.1 hypothetical protein Poly41_10790 [Novipirellula artificiosorum]